MMKTKCVFCQIANGEIGAHIIYQDADIICFLDTDPINVGHVLIVPVGHYLDADDLPDSISQRVMIVSRAIVKTLKDLFQPDGYSMMQNGGIFNDIGHYHMHVFPRFANDGFGWSYDTDTDKSQYCNPDIAQQLRRQLSTFRA